MGSIKRVMINIFIFLFVFILIYEVATIEKSEEFVAGGMVFHARR